MAKKFIKSRKKKTSNEGNPNYLSLIENAELVYRDLILQFSALTKEQISPELVGIAQRTAKTHQKLSRRKDVSFQRKASLFNRFVGLAADFQKQLDSVEPIAAPEESKNEIETPVTE